MRRVLVLVIVAACLWPDVTVANRARRRPAPPPDKMLHFTCDAPRRERSGLYRYDCIATDPSEHDSQQLIIWSKAAEFGGGPGETRWEIEMREGD